MNAPRALSHLWRPLVLIPVLSALLAGCATPYNDPRLGRNPCPADFALVFNVHTDAPGYTPAPGFSTAPTPGANDPLRQSYQYVLEPDRKLRVAYGAGTSEDYYPRLTRQITPDEYDGLFLIANDEGILAEIADPNRPKPGTGLLLVMPPTQPATADAVRYRITLIAYGRTYTLATTPEESPRARQLLAMLANLRDGRPLLAPGFAQP